MPRQLTSLVPALIVGSLCTGLGACTGLIATEGDAGPVAVAVQDGGSFEGSCAVDDECPFGSVCRGGACVPSDPTLQDEGCWTDDDCPQGERCASSTGRCVDEAAEPDPVPPPTGECEDGQTRLCGTKVGRCEYGAETCENGLWDGKCEGEVTSRDELCDGLDDDCDGSADEDFVLGGSCADGIGACRQEGALVCSADGSDTSCSAVALDATGRVELCGNDIDDDCDEDVDEDFTVGDACSVGVGACQRDGLTACAANGLATECSAVPGVGAAEELCGAAGDDDCDGETEEGFEAVGQVCSVGIGACQRSGTFICSFDQLSTRCSAVPGVPALQELCGGGDDDCNGQTDEGFELLGTACTLGAPPCETPGTWGCSVDRLGLVCEPDVPAGSTEVCDGADNDGDTCVDEDFDVGAVCAAGIGACRALGNKVCSADQQGTECDAVPGPAGPAEICGNGEDDDCDGQQDEDYALGAVCTAGVGICERSGVEVCDAGGLSTVCDAVPGGADPLGEICGNNMDDDCNGVPDDGFDVGQACSVGQGICARSGVKVCAADGRGTVCSATPGAPNAAGEICGNGQDDDCDGLADSVEFDVGDACTEGLGICEAAGVKVCDAGGLSTECSAVPGPAHPDGELCANGDDDDCDGFVDEGFANLGNACSVGIGECARTGSFVCSGDLTATVCSATAGVEVTELCDDLDNDCNGILDNGCDDDDDDYCDAALTFVGSSTACPLSLGASTLDCDDADASRNPGAAEICFDQGDQNCDGDNNDGCPMCDPGVDRDFDGSNECEDCDETNGSIFPGATERCDGLDNDCNGQTDEPFDVDNDTYTTCGTLPAGGLSASWIDCDDDDATRHPFACELCALGSASNTVACGAANDMGNNIDEDCDGYVDELCTPCSTLDPDGDGYSECEGDCAPGDGNVSPGLAEICDGLDTDCNATTVDNCAVSEPCNWPGTPSPDECAQGLFCVESLGGGGNPTGDFTCTSLCNTSELGLGLGDGCQADQTCSASLTPTANEHGCQAATDIGALSVGQACGGDADCRSGYCLRDQRLTGPPDRYCSDYCGNSGYCAGGLTCQVWGSDTARCWKELSFQDRGLGVACNDTSIDCAAGPRSCTEVAPGDRICGQVCCAEADCPGGYTCSLEGTDSPGPVGGYDTVPTCWPQDGANEGRPAGAACAANTECSSEFCDRNLNVCVDLCCNDSTCPSGLTCEDLLVTRSDGHQTFGRMCVNVTPANPLEPL